MLGANYYFPLFESKLDEFNLPLEFKYLAIVESALDPQARSVPQQQVYGNLCMLLAKYMI